MTATPAGLWSASSVVADMVWLSEINVLLDSSPAGMMEGNMKQENERATLRLKAGSENTESLLSF